MGAAIPPLNCFGITVAMLPSNRDVSKRDVNIQLSPNQEGLNEPSHIAMLHIIRKKGVQSLRFRYKIDRWSIRTLVVKMELNRNENTLLAKK